MIIRTPVFTNSLLVSVARVVVGTPCILLFTMTMGYILSRHRLPGRQPLIVLVLVTILFPGGLIPTYLVVSGLGLLNTLPVVLRAAADRQLGGAGVQAVLRQHPARDRGGGVTWTGSARSG